MNQHVVTHEEELEQLRQRIRVLEFIVEKNPAKFNPYTETVEIGGLNYSMALFQGLGSFLPIGALFELVDRAGGSITIRHIVTELDVRRILKTTIEREAQRAAGFALLDNPGDLFHP